MVRSLKIHKWHAVDGLTSGVPMAIFNSSPIINITSYIMVHLYHYILFYTFERLSITYHDRISIGV